MITTLAFSALLMAQAGTSFAVDQQAASTAPTEVAFEEMANGRHTEAVTQIEALLAENPEDPALLINLGSAYLHLGDLDLAADSYRRAIESDERYNLELADGSWVDSRRAARQALENVEGRQMAMR